MSIHTTIDRKRVTHTSGTRTDGWGAWPVIPGLDYAQDPATASVWGSAEEYTWKGRCAPCHHWTLVLVHLLYLVRQDIIQNDCHIIHNRPDLVCTVECDEGCIKAVLKGIKIDGSGRRTIPSRRIIPRGLGRGTYEKDTPMVTGPITCYIIACLKRGTYEKDTPMVTAAYQRCSETSRDCVIYGVSKGVKRLA